VCVIMRVCGCGVCEWCVCICVECVWCACMCVVSGVFVFLKCIALQECLEGKSKGRSKNKNFGSPSSFVDLWCAHLTP